MKYDPTRDEMLNAISKEYGGQVEPMDVECAIYWFATNYHGGQSTNLYSVLSTSQYKPGMAENGVPEGTDAADVFSFLENLASGEEPWGEDHGHMED